MADPWIDWERERRGFLRGFDGRREAVQREMDRLDPRAPDAERRFRALENERELVNLDQRGSWAPGNSPSGQFESGDVRAWLNERAGGDGAFDRMSPDEQRTYMQNHAPAYLSEREEAGARLAGQRRLGEGPVAQSITEGIAQGVLIGMLGSRGRAHAPEGPRCASCDSSRPAGRPAPVPRPAAIARVQSAERRLFDEGPNRWVPTGNEPTGQLVQRGMSGDMSASARGSGGVDEARAVFDGTSTRYQTLSIVPAGSEDAVTRHTTSEYSSPLAIRGRLPDDVVDAHRQGDTQMLLPRSLQPGEISAVGAFPPTSSSDARLGWAEGYLRAQDQAGIRPTPGSRGAAFSGELREALGRSRWEENDMGRYRANDDEIARAVGAIIDRYP